jgi:hypothetical protein
VDGGEGRRRCERGAGDGGGAGGEAACGGEARAACGGEGLKRRGGRVGPGEREGGERLWEVRGWQTHRRGAVALPAEPWFCLSLPLRVF